MLPPPHRSAHRGPRPSPLLFATSNGIERQRRRPSPLRFATSNGSERGCRRLPFCFATSNGIELPLLLCVCSPQPHHPTSSTTANTADASPPLYLSRSTQPHHSCLPNIRLNYVKLMRPHPPHLLDHRRCSITLTSSTSSTQLTQPHHCCLFNLINAAEAAPLPPWLKHR